MPQVSVLFCVATLAVLALWLPSSEAETCHKFGIGIKQGKTVSAPVGRCMQITCINASKNHIGAITCPAFQIAKGCRRSKEDLSKRYPDCCPKLK